MEMLLWLADKEQSMYKKNKKKQNTEQRLAGHKVKWN